MTTVTDLAEQQKLFFCRGLYNIIDCGIRTGKTVPLRDRSKGR